MKTNTKQSIVALMTAAAMAIPFVFAAGEPEDVSNVAVTPVDATTLTVSWDEALDNEGNAVDHYRLYYGTASVIEGEAPSYEVEVDTPNNETSYNLSGLETDTTYYVAVTALDNEETESLNYSIEASGTPTEVSANEEDLIAPAVVNVIAADKNHVLVGFSEAVKLPELLAEAAFTITEQINPANVLEITSAEQYADDPDGKTVILTTADQTKNVNYIMTASVAITDLDGNPIGSGNTDSGLFLGSGLETVSEEPEEDILAGLEEDITEEMGAMTEEENVEENIEENIEETADTIPPEDITNFVLTFKEELEKFIIVMNWTASINSAQDLIDQILYASMDKGITYDEGTSLGSTATTHQIPNLEGGKEYTFKITTKDVAGNESVGVVKSIRLPQTGVGAGMLLFGSILAAGRMLKRKKDKDVF